MSIKVFGAQAQSIEQGQQFTANVTYVEGRKVVELKEIPKVFSYSKICSNCEGDNALAFFDSDPVCHECFDKLAYDREMETRSDDY